MVEGPDVAWAKFDDRYDDNRKIKRAWRRHPRAVGLHAMSVTYCARHETDGFVDDEWLEERLPAAREREAVCEALVECGLYEPTEGGYLIHDFLRFNPSKADLEDRREKDRTRKSSAKIAAGTQTDSNGNPDGSNPDSRAPAGANGLGRVVPLHGSEDERIDARARGVIVRELFAYWQERCAHASARLTNDRRTKVEARLREGFTAEQIRQAIDGAARAAYIREDTGKKYDDLELICRTGSKLEDFIERGRAQRGGGPARGPKAEEEALEQLVGGDSA